MKSKISLSRIWLFIKTFFRRLFRDRNKTEIITESIEEPKEELTWQDKHISGKRPRYGRFLSKSQYGPNMPKRQPCPKGHGWKRRLSKVANGAWYGCVTCQDTFFIRAGKGV